MTSWFYWSEAQRNVKGEDLATCLHLYGTSGEHDNNRDLETELVFLDETRSTGYSWLLTVTLTGTLVPVRLYEANPNTFKVLGAPPTSVGVVKQ
jgi:hypothetical protein